MLRYICLMFFSITFNFTGASAQQNNFCYAIYQINVMVNDARVSDTLRRQMEQDSSISDATQDSQLSQKLSELLSSLDDFQFKLRYVVLSDGQSIRHEYPKRVETDRGLEVSASLPDSVLFRNGIWTLYSGRDSANYNRLKHEWAETGQTKFIQGYRCREMIQQKVPASKAIQAWVCPDLPNSLIPVPGLIDFPYAILEWNDPDLSQQLSLIRVLCTGNLKSNSVEL